MRFLLFIIPFMLIPRLAGAEIYEPQLTITQENRADFIDQQLRCLVCQNESIADSSAPLALQLRQIIRQQISSGASNAQIKQYMVKRYGIFILLKPPFKSITFMLYASPFLALLIGGIAFYLSCYPAEKKLLSLTKSEQARLEELLK